MNVIGINAFHGDSSACLLVEGELKSAVEEERFRRIKHWAGFPSRSIDYCLQSNGLSLSDVDVIAINTDPNAARWKKVAYTLKGQASFQLVREKLSLRGKRKGIRDHLAEQFTGPEFHGKIEYVEHHLAHLASAYTVSPFEQASIVSVDGFGDFASAAWGIGTHGEIKLQDRVYFPHSLGIFYQTLTQYLGFDHYGDEYKIMGLAPYGEPRYRSEMDQILRQSSCGKFDLNLDYFRHHSEKVAYQWDGGEPRIGRLFSDQLVDLLGPVRAANEPLSQYHKDLARSIQDAYERAFFNLLDRVYADHESENLTLSGGCAMNSVANGKVHLRTPFKKLYVQSAAGDAGGAIGAACIASQRSGVTKRPSMEHAYLGAQFSDTQMAQLLAENEAALDAAKCQVELDVDIDQLVDSVSDCIIEGQVIGWFQGAMEWGPRALGNRSILGDPRRSDMKDILNLKIKRRESFRPFAPSVMREHVGDWFESDADVPFMMKVFQIREQQRDRIPAVTHVDGSGRLQTVTATSNARYYRLIQAFYKKTDVPMLLNTSFNENEPVVCKPQEALDCFLRTNMDVLVLGSHLITRTKSSATS